MTLLPPTKACNIESCSAITHPKANRNCWLLMASSVSSISSFPFSVTDEGIVSCGNTMT